MRYRLENTRTGDVLMVTATDRKSAYEVGCAIWAGEVVTVETEREYLDTQVWRFRQNAFFSFVESGYGHVADSEDAEVVSCLNRAIIELTELRNHFAKRLPDAEANAEDEGIHGNSKPTLH